MGTTFRPQCRSKSMKKKRKRRVEDWVERASDSEKGLQLMKRLRDFPWEALYMGQMWLML